MPLSTYYVQECPTCGRNLQVRVKYLGKQVVCQHCGAQFEACEPSSAAYPPAESSLSLLERAEELLESTSSITVDADRAEASKPAAVRPK